MTEHELKPCPFCGGKAAVRKGYMYHIDSVRAHCESCGVTMPNIPIDYLFRSHGQTLRLTKEQAVVLATKEWNRRANNGNT